MAKPAPEPQKRPGFFSQIRSLFTFTKDEFAWIGWVLLAIVTVISAAFIIAAFLTQAAWWNILLWGISGVLLGLVVAMIVLTRFSTKALYRKLEGMQGAAGHVISNMLGRSWRGTDMPVGVNPKTQEAVYRTVGRGGIVVVGEGSKARLKKLMRDEQMKAKRVANGVAFTELYVGRGDDEVPIDELAKTIKKLPKALNKASMGAVTQRIESVSQSITSLPIPKGIDPMRARAPRPR